MAQRKFPRSQGPGSQTEQDQSGSIVEQRFVFQRLINVFRHLNIGRQRLNRDGIRGRNDSRQHEGQRIGEMRRQSQLDAAANQNYGDNGQADCH